MYALSSLYTPSHIGIRGNERQTLLPSLLWICFVPRLVYLIMILDIKLTSIFFHLARWLEWCGRKRLSSRSWEIHQYSKYYLECSIWIHRYSKYFLEYIIWIHQYNKYYLLYGIWINRYSKYFLEYIIWIHQYNKSYWDCNIHTHQYK